MSASGDHAFPPEVENAPDTNLSLLPLLALSHFPALPMPTTVVFFFSKLALETLSWCLVLEELGSV